MSEGFFSRWAKRKEAVREGKAVAPEPPVPPQPSLLEPSPAAPGSGMDPQRPAQERTTWAVGDPHSPPVQAQPTGSTSPPPADLPTLKDVQSLTAESDFTRFTRPGVDPAVKTAAMKKLFSDPHFNVMDRLDTYIDDYSQPDPIPPEMLRQLVSARFLKLFEEKNEEDSSSGAPAAGVNADDPVAHSVAQSGTAGPSDPAVPPPAEPDADDPDLRLQQDHAAGPPGSRQRPG